ncbi:sensor histidine kinase [Pseudanabaena sp. FACHB-2040]|uniref:sensor histidine kinase n=1 Tax=Pseudanabaena sp. FACHB-2040 TaxID=2692859 RepID=UPI00168257EF|nr:sensor histidine kinase [Pseudanabaena sp. FACHB-2040]MBD2257226.1 sensor histidine kinase [Pseudanabaena sp. FACHB-2040]
MDFSQALLEKSDYIVESWVSAVRQDEQISVTQELTYTAIRNSLPDVLSALGTVLSKSTDNDLHSLVEASLKHGQIRAEQGFEPAEIAREYRLLRSIIFSELEPDLLRGSPADMLRAVRLIDTVIDEAIARCFHSYTDGRMEELKQLQGQLNLTNQELTRLVRASKENLSHLAHELKTPLTSIIGYTDLFLRQQRKQSDLRDTFPNLESIERVLQSGRLLLRLINDALEISRYDAGKMSLQLMPTHVPEVLNGVMTMVEPLARSKDLALILRCDRAPASVTTDPLRLQQVITNLLSNAIRYTETGSISLECYALSEEQWAITITDSGVGISQEDQSHIFEPYFRAPASELAPSQDGTGLGLSIVSRLTKLLQGEIKLESSPGVGSAFTVVLPTVPQPAAVQVAQ